MGLRDTWKAGGSRVYIEKHSRFTAVRTARGSITVILSLKSLSETWYSLRDRHTDLAVQERAVFALTRFSEYKDGLAALAGTEILTYLSGPMQFRDRMVQLKTEEIMRKVTRYTQRARAHEPAAG
jgi:hypothetical protein